MTSLATTHTHTPQGQACKIQTTFKQAKAPLSLVSLLFFLIAQIQVMIHKLDTSPNKVEKPSKMHCLTSRGTSVTQEMSPEEIQAAKKKRRMERNREAAAASRERKKQYVKSLETSVEELRTKKYVSCVIYSCYQDGLIKADQLNWICTHSEKLERELILLRSYVNFVQPYLSKLQQQLADQGITEAFSEALQRISALQNMKLQSQVEADKISNAPWKGMSVLRIWNVNTPLS